MSDKCPWCGASAKRTKNVGLYFECDSCVQPDSVYCREQSDRCKLAVAERERDAAIALLRRAYSRLSVCSDYFVLEVCAFLAKHTEAK